MTCTRAHIAIVSIVSILLAFGFYKLISGKNMKSITIDVGEDWVNAAKKIGSPQVRDMTGDVHIFQYLWLPPLTAFNVGPKGAEVAIEDVVSVMLTTDQRRDNGRMHGLDLELNGRSIKSHQHAQQLTEKLIGQFQRGKWQRFISNSCPRVTGRSTLLGLSGTVDDRRVACPIDPALKLTLEEFSHLSSGGLVWTWIADGRIAKLEVDSSTHGASSTPAYSINLSFELKDAYEFYDQQWHVERRKDVGDADFLAAEILGASELKQLEEAAIKRGDSILPK